MPIYEFSVSVFEFVPTKISYVYNMYNCAGYPEQIYLFKMCLLFCYNGTSKYIREIRVTFNNIYLD